MPSSFRDEAPESGCDAQERVSPLIEHALLPMVEVEGAEHVVCFVNPAFCRLVHKTPEDLLGRPFTAIVRNGERCVPLLDRVYRTGELETHAEVDDTARDPAYWLFAMWPALGVGEHAKRVLIQMTRTANFRQNMTAMNEALILGALRQHELRELAEKSNAQLQVEIAEREHAGLALIAAIGRLKEAGRAAERGNRAKDAFLAALSHELRTPLTPVLLSAAALREDESLPAATREQLGMMERNIALEARLIDDLLDLTKISHGKLEFRPEPCDAHRLIMSAVEIVRGDAAAKVIALDCRLAARLSGLNADPTRFQQVIWNLLRNAVKFTPVGGRVTVSTANETAAGGEPWLRIEVADTGLGIPPERLEAIFAPFDQGGLDGDHRFGGVGLGLAIARAVVTLHHGKIHATSEGRGHGATVILALPGAGPAPEHLIDVAVPPPSTTLPAAPKPARPPVDAFRVLVVEDHATTREALRRLLERDGHRVVAAGTIAGALAAAAKADFDLVLTDLGLPDGSGTDLMKQLRDRPGLRGIALSGYGMDVDVARSLEAGFVTHLTKPVALAELRRVIAAVGLAAKEPPGPRTAGS